MTTYRPPQHGYAPINGLNLYYEIHGSGSPLVLLPDGFMTIDFRKGLALFPIDKPERTFP